jgi:ABC-type polysaccharide/polyol phosphate export permease
VYDPALVLEKLTATQAKLLYLNPLYCLVNMYRSILLLNELPSLPDILSFTVFAVLFLSIGLKYFQKNKRVFSDYI